MATPIDPEKLTAMPAIWAKLRKGTHIHESDGIHYYELLEHSGEYRAAFQLFGYTLVEHPGRFYYLDGNETDPLKQIRVSQLMAISFALIDQASTNGHGFDEWFFNGPEAGRTIEDFALFRTQQHRELLATAQITTPADIEKVLKYMTRLGFVKYDQGRVTFNSPFIRLKDLCINLARRGPEGIDQLAQDNPATADDTSEEENEL